jgi:hypothetical protein
LLELLLEPALLLRVTPADRESLPLLELTALPVLLVPEPVPRVTPADRVSGTLAELTVLPDGLLPLRVTPVDRVSLPRVDPKYRVSELFL